MRVNSFTSLQWLKRFFSFSLGIIIGYAIALMLSQTSSHLQLIGLFIAVGVPVWKEYFVTRSRLAVEINSIERKVADQIKIDLREYPDLKRVFVAEEHQMSRQQEYSYLFGPSNKLADSEILEGLEELDYFYEKLKKEWEELPQQITQLKKYEKELDDFSSENFSVKDAKSFLGSIDSIYYFYTTISAEEFSTEEKRKDKHEEFKGELKKQMDIRKQRKEKLDQLPGGIQTIKENVSKIKKDLDDNRSRFFISISLINSGRLNTSIKVPALLRIYIGRGTYVDLELIMKDPGIGSEIPAHSAKIIMFESLETSQLPEDSRNLVNVAWKNSADCIIFLEDIRGKKYRSQLIMFAPGAYQKRVYQELANFAANYNF